MHTTRSLLAILFLSALATLASCADQGGSSLDVVDTGSSDTTGTTGDADTGSVDTFQADTGLSDTSLVDTNLDDIDSNADADSDTIADAHEGAGEGRDTDGDGTPDYLDTDSDGDGIDDSVEAGDSDPATTPRDSDGDGAPDFRDTDSDRNGLPDAQEGTEDADGDLIPDFADLDDDNDSLEDAVEIGAPGSPTDSDGDGDPDFRDVDSDGDTILDRHEGFPPDLDTDGDGTPDRIDDDSDGDGILDSVEAGDADLNTPPVDTDSDLVPDFRDPDSDDDGLADDIEVGLGTSPILADSDGDGVTDLIEHAASTDPLNPADSPRSRGDFVFEVPYQETPRPERDTLQFRTAIRAADLYFAFDTSTTMSQEMDAMRSLTTGVPGIIDSLLCAETGVSCATDGDCGVDEVCGPSGGCAEDPTVAGCLLDLWTGVGSWDHVDSYVNLLSLQPNPAATANAIPTAPNWWVAPIQPAACIADPSNCSNTSTINCTGGGIGCPAFRREAIPIYVQITDAANECLCGTGTDFPCNTSAGPAVRCALFTTAYAGAELARFGIRFIGLIGDGPAYGVGDATVIANEIGIASGTVDSAGQPFVYSATDAAVVNRTVQAVRDIVTSGEFDITIDAVDEPGDAGDSLQFIERLEVNTTGPGCATGVATADTDGDGFDDAFTAINPGLRVCWDVVVRQNNAVPPLREPQVFRARLTVYADGSMVDARTVYFLVPADVTLPN